MRTLLLLVWLAALPAAAEPLRVAVAANFRATLETINAGFTAQGHAPVVLSSASTGVLATQILHGAPFHLFFAADAESPERLLQAGIGAAPRCYARGQLVLLGGGLDALAQPGQRLAIANPATAPYGRAALEVLARAPYRDAGQQLVRGNSVLQAYQFWRSGAAPLALVARSLAPVDGVAIPADWHQPLLQQLLVLRDHPVLAAYLEWLGSDRVLNIISEAGYLPCP